MTDTDFITVETMPHNKMVIVAFNGYKEKYIGYTIKEAVKKYRAWYEKEISDSEGVNKAMVLKV